jgi:hypothetical protein
LDVSPKGSARLSDIGLDRRVRATLESAMAANYCVSGAITAWKQVAMISAELEQIGIILAESEARTAQKIAKSETRLTEMFNERRGGGHRFHRH